MVSECEMTPPRSFSKLMPNAGRFPCLHIPSRFVVFFCCLVSRNLCVCLVTNLVAPLAYSRWSSSMGAGNEQSGSQWNGCALDYVVCQRGCSFIWLLEMTKILWAPCLRRTLIILVFEFFSSKQRATDARRSATRKW